MCYGCWEKAGEPRIVNDATIVAGALARRVNHYGCAHIVVADWNLEGSNLDFWAGEIEKQSGPPMDPAKRLELGRELLLLSLMRQMTEEERFSALAIARDFLELEDMDA